MGNTAFVDLQRTCDTIYHQLHGEGVGTYTATFTRPMMKLLRTKERSQHPLLEQQVPDREFGYLSNCTIGHVMINVAP